MTDEVSVALSSIYFVSLCALLRSCLLNCDDWREEQGKGEVCAAVGASDICRRAFQRFLTEVLTEVYSDLCSAVVFFEANAQLNERWDFKSPWETSPNSLTIQCSLHCPISTHTIIVFPIIIALLGNWLTLCKILLHQKRGDLPFSNTFCNIDTISCGPVHFNIIISLWQHETVSSWPAAEVLVQPEKVRIKEGRESGWELADSFAAELW